uniref:SWYG-3 n=1 Tax=Stichopus japonicus TaxID=307972 RepID=A0A2U8RMY1_STIJA|nr:SWYG-3 precursor [Apostichopus japonicus]
MALIRCLLAFAFIVCSVKTFAAPIEDEILDADALSRRGGWFHRLFHHHHHGAPADNKNQPKQREERQLIHDNRENAMLDDFEKKMAELSPAERFDWHALLHSVSKHVAKHVAENLKARVLAEEGERLPEGYDELTPEERSWYGSLASALLGR